MTDLREALKQAQADPDWEAKYARWNEAEFRRQAAKNRELVDNIMAGPLGFWSRIVRVAEMLCDKDHPNKWLEFVLADLVDDGRVERKPKLHITQVNDVVRALLCLARTKTGECLDLRWENIHLKNQIRYLEQQLAVRDIPLDVMWH